MKKSDFRVGSYYQINGGYVYSEINGYDQFIAYFYCPSESLLELLENFTPYSTKLISKKDVPYGVITPNFNSPKGTRVKCLSVKHTNATATRDEPFFNVVDEYGQPTNHFYVISNGRFVDPIDDDVFEVYTPKPSERLARADKLEKETEKIGQQIETFEAKLVDLREQYERNLHTISALRKYETDDDALAALLVEVMKAGADVEAVKEIMRKTGVTARL